MSRHDVYIGDGLPSDSSDWDRSVPTQKVLDWAIDAIQENLPGDEVVIVVRTLPVLPEEEPPRPKDWRARITNDRGREVASIVVPDQLGEEDVRSALRSTVDALRVITNDPFVEVRSVVPVE